MLAFNNKIKFIKAYVPDKVKLYINTNLSKELTYFQKKYSHKIDFIEENEFIIPEYKIELLNKSKKIIDKIENIKSIKNSKSILIKNVTKIQKTDKKNSKISAKSVREKVEPKKVKNQELYGFEKKKAS